MNDRAVGLLEQYDIEVLRTRKGRGAILCDTSQGCLILKEYTGAASKALLQDRLLKQIAAREKVRVEQIVPTKEGGLFVKDNDGVQYILKTYFEGRECNIYDKGECMDAVRLLGVLHGCMTLNTEGEELPPVFSPEKEYDKHNREMKKVRRYLQQKSQKTWFEIKLLNAFDYFLNQALEVTDEWKSYGELHAAQNDGDLAVFCHGDYQYHNIVRSGGDWCVINFEKFIRDNPVRDMYLLLRKLLEKSNWSITLGSDLLNSYQEVMPVSACSKIDLYYRLAYPEKFWKIANFYYNSRKAWIPERNQDKLEKLMSQEKEKQHFLDAVFRKVR